MRERWETMGAVEALSYRAFNDGEPTDLYVDAIFGTGLKRAPEGDLLEVLRYLSGSGGDAAFFTPRLVAVDAPSGLDLDSGRMLAGGDARPFSATVPLCSLTVTFEVPKVGHVLADGPACCGRLEVVDLGLLKWRRVRRDAVTGVRGETGQKTVPRARLVDLEPMVAPATPTGHWRPDFAKLGGHKYDHGHALIVSGPATRTGAARLAARAALRIGAGLVTLASPSDALAENAGHLTAIMARQVRRGGGPRRDPVGQAVQRGLPRARHGRGGGDAGDGAGRARRGPEGRAGRRRTRASFAETPDVLFEAIVAAHGRDQTYRETAAMTPHAGEFRRLFPDIAERWTAGEVSKLDAAREAAGRSGAVVLLKGPDTVVATPKGHAAINCAAYGREAAVAGDGGGGGRAGGVDRRTGGA
jgi:NAD(P)H-hydrate repair Nnr-like enzyme with NAD(P)H-hydrate dehydratase domain